MLLKEEQTAAYSVEIWKRFRKWGGIPTGLTQNVKDLLSSREVENIFENSDMIIMLNQAAGDRQKPFPQEEELAQKSARLAELNAQLDVDEKHHEPEQDEEEKEDAPRRSVLAVLEEKAEKAEPVKPFKSYLDKDVDAR